MKLQLVILTGLLSAAFAVPLVPATSGAIQLPFERLFINSSTGLRAKRSNILNPTVAFNEQFYYSINYTLGTPPQQVTGVLDTGSSDIYVFDSSAGSGPKPYYSSAKSSTYQYVKSGFEVGYGDGSSASGNLVKDVLGLGNGAVKVSGVTFGDMTTGATTVDVFGVGYAQNEAASQTYANLPVLLKNQGLIQATAYSLYLNDYATTSGTILFGGVDSEKYIGPLVNIPFDSYSAFYVEVQGITVTGKSGPYPAPLIGQPIDFLLDSGTTLTYLPEDAVDSIALEFGFFKDASGYYVKLWKDIRSDTVSTVNYKFADNLTIKVPISQIAVPHVDNIGNPITDPVGDEYGALGIFPNDGIGYILGDTFLRAAYIVYDLDSNQASMAQAKFDSTSSNVQVITDAGVPGSVSAIHNDNNLCVRT